MHVARHQMGQLCGILKNYIQEENLMAKMEGFPGGPIGILNICAPIKSIERSKLWEYLKMKLLKDYEWI